MMQSSVELCTLCKRNPAVQWIMSKDGRRIKVCDDCCADYIDEGLDGRRERELQ